MSLLRSKSPKHLAALIVLERLQAPLPSAKALGALLKARVTEARHNEIVHQYGRIVAKLQKMCQATVARHEVTQARYRQMHEADKQTRGERRRLAKPDLPPPPPALPRIYSPQ